MDYAKTIKEIYKIKLKQDISKITDGSKGYENRVFIIETNKGESVIRIPIKKKDESGIFSGKHQALREYWASKAWSKLKIPVPKIILLDESRKVADFDYVIETKIPGTDLKDSNLTKEELEKIMFNIGRYLKIMHFVKTKKYGFLLNNLEGRSKSWKFVVGWVTEELTDLKSKNLLTPKKIKEIEKYFSTNSKILDFKDPRLLHNDIQGNNIVIKDKQISGIIDMGDAMSGDPIYDLARAYQGLYVDFSEEFVNKMLEGYGNFDIQKFNYYLLFHACWTHMFFVDEKKPNYANRSEQLINKVLKNNMSLHCSKINRF